MNRRIRVLFYLFFPAGGIGKYTDQLLADLVQNEELDIEVVCLPDYQWQGTDRYITWPGLFGISHRVPVVRKARFLLAQFLNPIRLLDHAMAMRADIIHICNINYLSFPFWRGRLDGWGGKLVCSAHDIRRSKRLVNRRWEEHQLKAFYRRCDALFVHSRGQAGELKVFASVRPERIHLVPHGPHVYAAPPSDRRSVLRARYGIAPDRQVALFFGFLREDKNLDGFLQAMAEAGVPGLHLVVAGNVASRGADYLTHCRDMVRSLGLEDQVTIEARFIPDEEIPSLFKLSDWVVQTYSQQFTSQSGVLNLAAFYERPVLATPTVSFQELLEDVPIGELCNGFKMVDIAEGIRRMIRSVEQGKSWAFSDYRSRYSWARNAEITKKVYCGLLQGTRPE